MLCVPFKNVFSSDVGYKLVQYKNLLKSQYFYKIVDTLNIWLSIIENSFNQGSVGSWVQRPFRWGIVQSTFTYEDLPKPTPTAFFRTISWSGKEFPWIFCELDKRVSVGSSINPCSLYSRYTSCTGGLPHPVGLELGGLLMIRV